MYVKVPSLLYVTEPCVGCVNADTDSVSPSGSESLASTLWVVTGVSSSVVTPVMLRLA